MLDIKKYTIDEKIEIFNSIVEDINNGKNDFNHISDVFSQTLKLKLVDGDEIYGVRKESRELDQTRGNIREQKRKLKILLDSLDGDALYFLSFIDDEVLKSKFVDMYDYCVKKGLLDIAKDYLSFLSINEIVDENFIKKGIFDIVRGYSKIAILSNTDQRNCVLDLVKRINEGKYNGAGKQIRKEAIIHAYNDEGIMVDWEGVCAVVYVSLQLSKKNLSKKQVSRKN